MPFYNVYGERIAREVTFNTWGHLMPRKDKVYTGWMRVAIGCYGDCMIIDWDFEDLHASPWQFDHFWANINKWQDEEKPEVGVYKFTGSYVAPVLIGVFDAENS